MIQQTEKPLTAKELKFQALLAKVRARSQQIEITESTSTKPVIEEKQFTHLGKTIHYNEKQKQFINTLVDIVVGKNPSKGIVLLGAAGTGKTTSLLGAVEELSQLPQIQIVPGGNHKYIESDTPGIFAVSFTRRSVANDKRAMPANLTKNCLTIHKMLEYEPKYYEIETEDGETKTTMRFEASRGPYNPLPRQISVVFVNEASMVSTELFEELDLAAGSKIIWVFTGDIQQLPPVFGSAILGFKILELPTIELTEVYRQALGSPIIRLAHRILSGNPLPPTEFKNYADENKLIFYTWKKKFTPEIALATAAKLLTLKPEEAAGIKTIPQATLQAFTTYDPEEDMILCPFNKSFGTIELNKYIAQDIAIKRQREVHEIIAGYNKHYFSIGDRVLFDKEDAEIVAINRNALYFGKQPMPASRTLNYWGVDTAGSGAKVVEQNLSNDEVDLLLEHSLAEVEDKANKASHIVTVKLLDNGREVRLESAADINNLLHGYAMTVHKAQGSEYRRVYLFLHQSHATMIQRELLYTAVTRAREELVIVCEEDTFIKGIVNQRIKGNTLAEKAEFFKGKLEKVL